jgi:hypothetical protein
LIVSPTVSPKYSLTSQNPASLTWEKNSDPHPMASTSRARWLADRLGASGATMPAAVMVATVAEPVPRRMSTATSHPRTSTEMLTPSAQSLMTLPTPASMRVCLKPPPAATMRMMLAIAGSADPTESLTWLLSSPEPSPRAM